MRTALPSRGHSAAVGRARPAGIAVAQFRHQAVEVEAFRRHADRIALSRPFGRVAVDIDFDAVAFRVVEVDRLADEVVRRAVDGDAVVDGVLRPAREVGAGRQQEGGVEQAGAARIVLAQRGRALDLEEFAPARAEADGAARAAQLLQAEHGLVEGRDSLGVARPQADAADADRRRRGKGKVGHSRLRSRGSRARGHRERGHAARHLASRQRHVATFLRRNRVALRQPEHRTRGRKPQ